jgi:hypothetical protein
MGRYEKGITLVSKIGSAIYQIMIHTVVVYCVMFASLLTSLLLVLLIPELGKKSSVVGSILEAPYWMPQILGGFIVGWLIRKRSSLSNAGYAILVPLCLLLSDILTEGLKMRKYTTISDIYFSANNGDTEGLYKLIFTAPLYAGIAYALGALVAKISFDKLSGARSRNIVNTVL